MPSIKKNLTANFFGKICTTLLSVVFLPLYIRIIGIEAYGLVGIYTTLLALFSLLDLGLCTTTNREMARMLPEEHAAEDFRNLMRTLEFIYWPVALLICAIVFLLAPFLANHWIQAKDLAPEIIKQAIYCIGLSLAFQWPSSLYNGALMGLQKQVLINGLSVAFSLIRAIGTLLILTYVSPTLQAFFIWQMIINLAQTLLSGFFLWRALPKSPRPPRFDKLILLRLKNFALGIAGTSVLVTVLTQLDKVILSKMLSLDMFGYYMLAASAASTLHYITGPIFTAFFPRFSQLVSANNLEELKRVYHISCQVVSATVLPAAIFAIFFSSEIVFLWTRNPEIANNTATIISLLMIGNLLNGFMTLPYALQLAYGWTKLGFYQNLVGIIVLTPCLFIGTYYFGAIGAALTWIVLNAGYILISIPIMHRTLIRDEKARWYIYDVGIPLLSTSLIILGCRWAFSCNFDRIFIMGAILLVIFILVLGTAILFTPLARAWVQRGLFRANPLPTK